MASTEAVKEAFRTKNAARKDHYHGTGTHKEARLSRRAYRGTFGNSGAEIWNHMIQGTGGAERRTPTKGD